MEYRITNNMENTAIARQFANTMETSQGHKLNGTTEQHLFVGLLYVKEVMTKVSNIQSTHSIKKVHFLPFMLLFFADEKQKLVQDQSTVQNCHFFFFFFSLSVYTQNLSKPLLISSAGFINHKNFHSYIVFPFPANKW